MLKTFSFSDRKNSINKMQSEDFDLLIVGGGINGAGAARDAASRGMKVCLIEARDFASGTSSKSSKLIHGGIRYLENLEFHLVFEALRERALLFDMAPHLVHPLRFMIPLYTGGRVGMFKMGLGMWLYDALALFDTPELHEKLNVKETNGRQPLLQSKDLLGSFVYSDAYMDDDRLTIETLRSAHNFNAVIGSYLKAESVRLSNNENAPHEVTVHDEVSNKKFQIRCKHLLSTVGPWTDEFGAKITNDWKEVLRPTKGVHLTFERKRLPLSSAVVMAAESRIVFGIPRHEMVIIGTTDTDAHEHPNKVTASAEDIKYLLDVTKKYFPDAGITKNDIIASYAGLRPLVRDGANSEGKTSREHSIWSPAKGITFVAGGKYTTYRLISQQAIEHCLKDFSLEERYRFRDSQTLTPLNPLVTKEILSERQDLESLIASKTKLSQQEVHWLVDRHGGEANSIVNNYGKSLSYWQLEAAHAVQKTMCFNIVDFYSRRSPLFLSQFDHGLAQLNSILEIFAEHLGWDKDQKAFQEQSLMKYKNQELSWQGSC